MRIRLTLTEPMLGTASADPKIHEEFIASKAPDAASMEEEVAAIGVEAAVEKSMTVFPRQDGKPFVWDYMIKGFFKAACSALRKVPDTKSGKIKAHKKLVDTLIFPQPRRIPLLLPEGGEIGSLQRPLRAQTMQGERVALATSETVPAGTSLEFDVVLLDPTLEPLVEEWLGYGKFSGLGQWRGGGWGRFSWEKA